MMRFTCPNCSGLSEASGEHAGQWVRCGHCGTHVALVADAADELALVEVSERPLGPAVAFLFIVGAHLLLSLLLALLFGLALTLLVLTVYASLAAIVWLVLGQPSAVQVGTYALIAWRRLAVAISPQVRTGDNCQLADGGPASDVRSGGAHEDKPNSTILAIVSNVAARPSQTMLSSSPTSHVPTNEPQRPPMRGVVRPPPPPRIASPRVVAKPQPKTAEQIGAARLAALPSPVRSPPPPRSTHDRAAAEAPIKIGEIGAAAHPAERITLPPLDPGNGGTDL